MERQALQSQRDWIQQELQRCVQFWLEHGMDKEFGGVATCLDREGNLYSTDKSCWMQGRCAWTFAALCRQYGKQESWLEASRSCLGFMEEHCINRAHGNRMYFTVTKEGRPLRQRRYSFSEGFYTIANGEYAALTGDMACMQRARDAYELIWKLNQGLMEDPVAIPPKTIPETRACRSLADPMIYLNISMVLQRCDPDNRALYLERAAQCVDQILRYHHKPELGCTLETVGKNGEFLEEISAGRVVNPGHAIECSWFMMEYANLQGDEAIRRAALEMFDFAINLGWDKEYGGILYFVDCKGRPPEAYEHDMKLWWPHNETVIASLMAYRDTGEESYYRWFEKTIAYCKEHFSDPEYGEWYGYLRRDGKPTMPASKGTTFKGPFHLHRMLMMADQILGELLERA